MDRLGVKKVHQISLAGAFGSHIDPKYAMLLGTIPDCPLDKVSSAGNAAGTGARIALLNKSARREIEELVQRIEKIETAVETGFQNHFMQAIAIPHKSDHFMNLRRTVDLPSPHVVTTEESSSPSVSRRQARRLRLAAGQMEGLSGQGQ